MVGRTGLAGGPQRGVERRQRRRPHHLQPDLARDRLQPLVQRPRDHLEIHVVEPAGARDDHQHPQHLARRRVDQRAGDIGTAADPAQVERQRRGPLGVLDQLPGQRQERRIGRTDHQLRLGLPGPLIGVPRRHARRKERREQRLAPILQLRLDRRTALGIKRIRGQKVPLQIPGQIGQVLRAKRRHERHRLPHRLRLVLAPTPIRNTNPASRQTGNNQTIRHVAPQGSG